MRRTAAPIAAMTLGALCVLAARGANAQSSGGTGGPLGEQSDFPCTGCVFGTPNGYDPTTPAPLIVTFHGDEGDPGYIHRAYYGNESGPAYDKGFLVASLQCPVDRGCADADPDGVPSWWRWRSSASYDAAWVGQQVDAIQAAYDVSLRQIYLASFSGGSSFLRRYAFENADRFAGAIIKGGGGQPDNDCLTTCKIPIVLSIGTADFLYDNAQQTRTYCEQCGHELLYLEHPGIEHEIIDEDLPIALDWLLERPHPCIAPDPGTGGAGGSGTGGAGVGGSAGGGTGGSAGSGTGGGAGTGGGQGGSGATAGTSSGSGGSVSGSGGSSSGAPPIGLDDDGGDESGCACRAAGRNPGANAGVFAMLALGLLGQRRRWKDRLTARSSN